LDQPAACQVAVTLAQVRQLQWLGGRRGLLEGIHRGSRGLLESIHKGRRVLLGGIHSGNDYEE